MARLSLSDIWVETRGFLQREGGLVFPLGLATIGIGMLVTNLIVPDPVAGQIAPGGWMVGLIPVLVLFLIGIIAISAITLTPGISVREAIRRGFARLGTAIALLLIFMAAATLLIILFSIVAVAVGVGLGWSMQQSTVLAVVLAVLPMIWLWARLIPLGPLIADRNLGPVASARASYRLTAGAFGRLAAFLILSWMLYILFTSAVQFAGGSIFLLLGRLIGSPGLGHTLTAILVSLVGAALGTVWTVFVALLYRRLAGSASSERAAF